jgi:hypothetical protein
VESRAHLQRKRSSTPFFNQYRQALQLIGVAGYNSLTRRIEVRDVNVTEARFLAQQINQLLPVELRDGGHRRARHQTHQSGPFANQHQAGCEVEAFRGEQRTIFAQTVPRHEIWPQIPILAQGEVAQRANNIDGGLRVLGKIEFFGGPFEAKRGDRITKEIARLLGQRHESGEQRPTHADELGALTGKQTGGCHAGLTAKMWSRESGSA